MSRRRVQKSLNTSESPEALLGKVSAEPVAQSNVVAVIATADSPEFAQELANAFANEAVVDRSRRLHSEIATTLPRLRTADRRVSAGSDRIGRIAGRRAGSPADAPERPRSDDCGRCRSRGPRDAGLAPAAAEHRRRDLRRPRARDRGRLRRPDARPAPAPRGSSCAAATACRSLPGCHREPSGKSNEKPLNPRSIAPVTAEAYRTLRATLLRTQVPGRRSRAGHRDHRLVGLRGQDDDRGQPRHVDGAVAGNT